MYKLLLLPVIAICGILLGSLPADTLTFFPPAENGVQISESNSPVLLNARGLPFKARGVFYYQPHASHFYFLRGLELDRIDSNLRYFKKMGFNTVGLGLSWGELIENADPNDSFKPVSYEHENIKKLRFLLDTVKKNQMYVYVLVGYEKVPPQVTAKCYKEVVDDTGRTIEEFKGYYIQDFLVNPAVNEGFKDYLTLLAKITAPYDNILCYALYFEMINPQMPIAYFDPLLNRQWRKYLTDRNPDITFWNSRWEADYKTISKIPLPKNDRDYWKQWYIDNRIEPAESHPLMWRDFYDFFIGGILNEGKYGMSFRDMRSAITKADADALLLFKPFYVERWAWELGFLEQYQKDKSVPQDAKRAFHGYFSPPGIDMIACWAYPDVTQDPEQRKHQVSFNNFARQIPLLMEASNLPVFCQEFGIDNHQWNEYECAVFLTNAVKYFQSSTVLGYNIWQSQDFVCLPHFDQVQPKFGLIKVNGEPYKALRLIRDLQINE